MTTPPNEMPEVIWAHLYTGDRCQGKFQTAKWEGLFDTSYTRTDLLEQRAKVAAENLQKQFSIGTFSRFCDDPADFDSATAEELTTIILNALKGETDK